MSAPVPAAESFSDSIVFVDESGDHSLVSIDPPCPMFVLAFWNSAAWDITLAGLTNHRSAARLHTPTG